MEEFKSSLSEEQMREIAGQVHEAVKNLLNTPGSIPADMSPDKVLNRIGGIMMIAGATRTTLLAAAVMAATNGPTVGLTKSQVLTLMEQAYDAVAAVAGVDHLAMEYKIRNEQAKEQALFAKLSDQVH